LNSSNTDSRRTQAERRATTRAALLDSTVESLVETGYAGTTTRAIAERAGMTPGALQHHFATKAELVTAAVGWIGQQLLDELLRQGLPLAGSTDIQEQLLDNMWEVHKGPLIAAIGELYLAARNDRQLRDALAETQRTLVALAAAAAAQVLPELAGERQAALLTTYLATLRGLAVVGYASEADRDAAWPATRAHLLALGHELESEIAAERDDTEGRT
jgi:AcrR family transcriptional regulator